MKKHLVLLCVWLCLFGLFNAAAASPSDVELLLQSRYSYTNVEGYGFFEKCADYSWFRIILKNGTGKDYTVTLPHKGHVTGWNGTVHTFTDFTYQQMLHGSTTSPRGEQIPFDGTMTLPANSTYGLFMNVNGMSPYSLYWNTDLYFTFSISDENESINMDIHGILAQHGNGCGDDKVCTAQVLSGSYAGDGNGEVVVHLKNNMPDAATITAKTNVSLEWIDENGETQTSELSDAVSWAPFDRTLNSGDERTITGVLNLPAEITAPNREIKLTFYFRHPSSLWFGNFTAVSTLQQVDGLHGLLNGSFEADGSGGCFSAVLNNHQSQAITLTLPAEGQVKASDGETSTVDISWNDNTVEVDAEGRSEIGGTFNFRDTSRIHDNPTFILSTVLHSDEADYTIAGGIVRGADATAVIRSIGFCRDMQPTDHLLDFAYQLKNDGYIDISADLAGTLAVSGFKENLPILYTNCKSESGVCVNRMDGSHFTIKAGETATIFGQVTLPDEPDEGFSIATSMLYYPNGETKALYIGKTTSGCGLEPTQTAEPTIEPTETEEPIETETVEPTLEPTEIDAPIIDPIETATEEPTIVPTEEEIVTEEPIETETAEPTFEPTEIDAPIIDPIETATEEPTIEPTETEIVTEEPIETETAEPTSVPTETDEPIIDPIETATGEPTIEPTETEIATEEPIETPIVLPTPEPAPLEPDLQLSVRDGSYSGCTNDPALRFTLVIRNDGNAAGDLPLSDIEFTDGNEQISVTFTDCTAMSGGGSNNTTCASELQQGIVTIHPNITMTLTGEYLPAEPITSATYVIYGSSQMLTPKEFEIPATSTWIFCQSPVEPIENNDGNELDINAKDGEITLSLRLVNQSNQDAILIPQTIYLHNTALKDYSGTIDITPFVSDATSKALQPIQYGQSLTLPTHSIADIQLSLSYDPQQVLTNMTAINWNYSIDGESTNYTGIIQFPRGQAPAPTLPTTPTGQQSSALSFYVIDTPKFPEILPSTGISNTSDINGGKLSPLGLTLQIPVYNITADLVRVPLDENGLWDVDSLNDQVGLLEDSALPGEGTCVIAGHNHLSETEIGPFLFLFDLDSQDRIFITDSAGDMRIFSVYENRLVLPTDSDAVLEAIPGSLVLITCEQEMPEGGYAYRRLVYAAPLE